MLDVLDALERHWRRGETVALATVVDAWQSAPRQCGAAMLVTASGEVFGSVSGGCVESAVYELATEIIHDATRPPVLAHYGVSDGTALSVGLTCGGSIDVFVERVGPGFAGLDEVLARVRGGLPVAIATVVAVRGSTGLAGTGLAGTGLAGTGLADAWLGRHLLVFPDGATGTLGHAPLDAAAGEDARGMLATATTGIRHYGADGERRGTDIAVFVASYAPPPRLIVFGATDFAAAVAALGAQLGYRVTACDARPVFATPARLAAAHEVVVDWPHRYLAAQAASGSLDERTVLCVMTHDPKFEIPLLQVALRLPVAYVGAMGSRRTHADRIARLREAGLSDSQLARLRSPAGLDLGARTPQETAVSILAEVIADRWGGCGAPLSELDGPIHREGD